MPCYYDLLYDHATLKSDGNVMVRLAGNTVKEIIHGKK